MRFKRVMFNIHQDFGRVLNDAVQLSMNDECNVLIQSECGAVFILIDINAGTVRFRPELVEAAKPMENIGQFINPYQATKPAPQLAQTETCDGCGHVKESVHDFSSLPDDALFALMDEIDARYQMSRHFAKRFNHRQIDKIAEKMPETAKLFQMLDDVFHGEHSRD